MRTATHLNMRLNAARPARRTGLMSPRRLWFPMALVALALAGTLAGCAGPGRNEMPPEAAAAPPPPPPPPPAPPPVDLTGRWRLTETGQGGCFMNFGHVPSAAQGTIAPEGGCPGNFFTSRKWTYERSALVIRDHKGDELASLAFAAGHFEGRKAGGGAVTLAR